VHSSFKCQRVSRSQEDNCILVLRPKVSNFPAKNRKIKSQYFRPKTKNTEMIHSPFDGTDNEVRSISTRVCKQTLGCQLYHWQLFCSSSGQEIEMFQCMNTPRSDSTVIGSSDSWVVVIVILATCKTGDILLSGRHRMTSQACGRATASSSLTVMKSVGPRTIV
jgi:hypothetical protein